MAREITTHHDGYGLNESIQIVADEPGPGGAAHRYQLLMVDAPGSVREVGLLQFQLGPRGVEGSTPGLTVNAVLAVLIDHLQGFQSGEYKCRENALVITKLEEAMHWVRHRADARAKRGVLGTYAK